MAERGATYTPGLDPYRVPIGAATLGYDPRASLTIKAQPPTYVQPPLYTAAQVQAAVSEAVAKAEVKLIREFIADCTGHPVGAGDSDTYIVKTPNIRAWERRLAEARSHGGEG